MAVQASLLPIAGATTVGAKYVVQCGVDMSSLQECRNVFHTNDLRVGSAWDAISNRMRAAGVNV